jgi:hypothetical protein
LYRLGNEYLLPGLIGRYDTLGLLEWYLNMAYSRMSEKRGLACNPDPVKDLKLMTEYWNNYQDA